MGAHSLIGASSMSRLIACPGSFRLSQQAVQTGAGTTIYAATGTVAHALAEEAMTQGYDPAREIGAVVTVDGHDVEVTQEMVDAVRIYIDLVDGWRTTADRVELEDLVVLDNYWKPNKPPVPAFGTADAWAYYAARFHVDLGDYKNGAGVFVEVDDNPQFFYYAAGVIEKLRQLGLLVRTVTVYVVQPNVRGQDKIRKQELTALDVRMWVDDVLKPAVAALMAPDAPLSAGKHCRFCPARVGCPARNKLRQDAARRDFGPNYADLVNFTADELRVVLDELEVLEDHTKALREHALERITKGNERIPGWDAVPTRPVRSWDKSVTEQHLAAATGRLDDIFVEERVKSPAQIEKLLKPDEWDAIKGLVVSKSSGVKLARDNPAENSTRPSARDDFA